MEYRFAREEMIAANVTVTLGDLDTLIDILEPIAQDNSHDMRYRAADMRRQLADVRKRLVAKSSRYLTSRDQNLAD